MTEIKLNGENITNGWVICIPYEINHNFFVEIALQTQKQFKNLPHINIAGPDFGRGYILEGEILNNYIKNCEYVKNNLDEIIKFIPLPKNIGKFDDHYIKGFVINDNLDNYIEGESKLKQEDILLLLDLIIKKANESIDKGIGLQFVGD